MSGRAPNFPGSGAPCNGCGLCCAACPCRLAEELLNNPTAPCPALRFDSGRMWCGLIQTPSRYIGTPEFADEVLGAEFAKMLGAGKGCDADPAYARLEYPRENRAAALARDEDAA